jgi:hypothetical protein
MAQRLNKKKFGNDVEVAGNLELSKLPTQDVHAVNRGHLRDSFASTETPPASPFVGQRWVQTSTGRLAYWTGNEWVEIGATTVNSNPSILSVATGGTTGDLLVKQSGTDFDTAWQAFGLDDLSDVDLTGVGDDDILQFDSALGVFLPVPVPASLPTGGTTGQVLTKASATDFDAAWNDPQFSWGTRSGAYYGPMASATANAGFANRITCVPLFLPKPTLIDRIAFRIVTGGAAGSLVRLGVYSSGANGLPDALLHDFGTVDGTVPATVVSITVSETLQGFVWLAARFNDQSAIVVAGNPLLAHWVPQDINMAVVNSGVQSAVQTSGDVLVNPFPISTASTAAGAAMMRVRAA